MEQLMFFLLKVSDADPNTATSVAPAATFKKQSKWTGVTALDSHLRKGQEVLAFKEYCVNN